MSGMELSFAYFAKNISEFPPVTELFSIYSEFNFIFGMELIVKSSSESNQFHQINI